MLFAVGFIFVFIIGGLSGVMHSIAPSDAQQQDTYFIVAHIHYVLFGAAYSPYSPAYTTGSPRPPVNCSVRS